MMPAPESVRWPCWGGSQDKIGDISAVIAVQLHKAGFIARGG